MRCTATSAFTADHACSNDAEPGTDRCAYHRQSERGLSAAQNEIVQAPPSRGEAPKGGGRAGH